MNTRTGKNQQRDLRLTLSHLEQLTTHEIADLFSNVGLLLSSLPDVPFHDLGVLPLQTMTTPPFYPCPYCGQSHSACMIEACPKNPKRRKETMH
jgi:hypothetical protein